MSLNLIKVVFHFGLSIASKIKDSEDHDPVIHYLEDIPNDFYNFSTLNDHLKREAKKALSSDEIFIDNLLTTLIIILVIILKSYQV